MGRLSKEERADLRTVVTLYGEGFSRTKAERVLDDLDAADDELAAVKREWTEWSRIATNLRAKVEKYEDYLRNRASCPCCEGIDECDEECTFADDCPDENEAMWHVRDLLFGKEERRAILTEYGKARKAWIDWKAYKAAIDIMHNIPRLVNDLDAADSEIASLKEKVERYERALQAISTAAKGEGRIGGVTFDCGNCTVMAEHARRTLAGGQVPKRTVIIHTLGEEEQHG